MSIELGCYVRADGYGDQVPDTWIEGEVFAVIPGTLGMMALRPQRCGAGLAMFRGAPRFTFYPWDPHVRVVEPPAP
jgi:hypothetical protein